jgi:hypothetical protein
VEDERGCFGWGVPDHEEVHSYINQLASSVGTYLYGRRMYETMVYWETVHLVPNQPQFVLDWARQWQAAEKIVYSRTLAAPRSAGTRIEREFDLGVVRRLKADLPHDITVRQACDALCRTSVLLIVRCLLPPSRTGTLAGTAFCPDALHLDRLPSSNAQESTLVTRL